ncbi:MAG: translation initiation factor IF-2 [Mucinivorans sp.]
MTEQKKIRLSGVAKEYNVGTGTLIEFLEKKGVTIEHGPNTQLDAHSVGLISTEFGGNTTRGTNIKERLREVEKAKVTIESKPSEETQEREVTIKSNIYTSDTPHLSGPKVVGKIDLEPQKTVQSLPVESPQKVEPVAVVAKTEVKQKKEVSSPEVKAKPKPEVKIAPTEVKAEQTTPKKSIEPAIFETPKRVSAQPKILGKMDLDAHKKSVQKTSQPNKVEQHKAKTAEPVKVAPVAKVEVAPEIRTEPVLFRANEPEKLAGPKILGTMVLPAKNSGSDDRRRRNRIKKNKVDVANTPGTAAPATGTAARPAGAAGGAAGRSRDRRKPGGANNRVAPKPIVHEAVSEEDVQKQIKETLSRLTSKGNKSKSAKYRRDKRDAGSERREQELERVQQQSDTLQVTEFVTVSELASMMDVPVTQVIAACMNLGLMVSINQRLDAEALAIVAEEFGYKVEFVSVEIQEAIESEEDKPEDLVPRPPIVTVMGHVDHGKTSLLDYIRKANVIAGEAGGITQHIGAYSVKIEDGRRVTFLDTPGHEAFTAMRARGAKVTDVAIIIIAADDNIMPQTKEAINHAEAAGVPIIFAINKIDKPGANPEKIKEQLSAMNYLVEEWGGKYQSQDIAAKSGLNIDLLLEKVVLESEMLDLKANPMRKASGSVIESTLDKGRGFVTTLLVQNGTLNVGDILLSGIYSGRVKAMFNERGKKITSATPATPVLVLGLNGAPQAGDTFNVMDDDKSAREIATKREQLQRMQGLRTQKHITLDEIGRRIAIGSFKELNLIVKGDVDGSIEALTDSLIELSTEEVQVNVIHKAVGAISESDVLLAAASNAIIVGFQVRPSNTARRIAEAEEIDIRLYSIIYDAIGEIKDAIEGMLAPETKEEIISSVEVLEVFKITKVGSVAGCIVREGKISRNSKIRVIRDGIVIYTGKLGSLKRFKDDVKDVNTGLDCGLNIENFNDIKVGDFVESYETVEIARKL